MSIIKPDEYRRARAERVQSVIPSELYEEHRQTRASNVVGPEMYVRRDLPSTGYKFSLDTLKEMKRIVGEAKSRSYTVNMYNPQTQSIQSVPFVEIVARLLSECENDTCRITKVFGYATSLIQFQNDPDDMELVKTPQAIYNDIIRNQRKAGGDCDDSATFITSMFAVAGMKTGFLAVANKPGDPQAELDHVMSVVYNRDVGQWEPVDPIAGARDWRNHRHVWDMV